MNRSKPERLALQISGMGKKELKKFQLLIFPLLIFIILTFPLKAQVISPEIYETEEDLKEGLEQGDLTLDEYLELLDLIRSKFDLHLKVSVFFSKSRQFAPSIEGNLIF